MVSSAHSNFGMLAGRCAREAEPVGFGPFQWGNARREAFSRALRRVSGGAHRELNCEGPSGRGRRV